MAYPPRKVYGCYSKDISDLPGESVSVREKWREKRSLAAPETLILVHTPGANKEILEEFLSETAVPLDFAIRSIIGLAPEAVEPKFALKHPALKAKQTRFLRLLKNRIVRYGSITRDMLYEQPFTVVDIDGPDGVFNDSEEIDELMIIIDQFAPSTSSDSKQQESSERVKDQ